MADCHCIKRIGLRKQVETTLEELGGLSQPAHAQEHDPEDDDSVAATFVAADQVIEYDAGPQLAESAEALSGTTAFWKRLSNFDTSTSSAPGQIIIPKRFGDFFPPMTVQRDDTANGGVRQSECIFTATFKDGAFKATLTLPTDPYQRSGGRQGLHTEHLGSLLAEMQWLARSHPEATW